MEWPKKLRTIRRAKKTTESQDILYYYKVSLPSCEVIAHQGGGALCRITAAAGEPTEETVGHSCR